VTVLRPNGVLAIVGATATGKSELAVALAEPLSGRVSRITSSTRATRGSPGMLGSSPPKHGACAR
jgi:ABC-type phosphonate transport system ATPase subunit